VRLAESLEMDTSVYVLGDGKYVKIGTSMDVEARVKQLRLKSEQTLCPDDLDHSRLRLYLSIPGNRRTEQHIHHEMRAYRVVGEWFTDCREVWMHLESLGLVADREAAS
jgi:hypothetical protein